jgi:hypothetical protein
LSPWRDHNGGDCPTHPEAKVRFRFRNGWEPSEDRRAGAYVWRHRGWEFDVVAYRVVGVPQEIRE